jgi:hypothetical protein
MLLLLEPVAVKLFVSVVLLPNKCSPLKDKKMCDLCRDPETDWKGKNRTVVSIDQLGVHVRVLVLSACRQILTAEYLLGEEGCPQDLKHCRKLEARKRITNRRVLAITSTFDFVVMKKRRNGLLEGHLDVRS